MLLRSLRLRPYLRCPGVAALTLALQLELFLLVAFDINWEIADFGLTSTFDVHAFLATRETAKTAATEKATAPGVTHKARPARMSSPKMLAN